MSYEQILVFREGAVGRVQLNRPQALNALNYKLLSELADALRNMEQDPDIRAIVLHGDDRAFAAGADIKEMAEMSAVEMMRYDFTLLWEAVAKIRKPIVAAVSGFVLGGGLELAMNCDIIVASETTRFGLPETSIGTIPGAGGTQRLVRAVGKSLAMEMVLSGRMLSAQEGKAAGLCSKVAPVEAYLEDAKKLAVEIAVRSSVAIELAKEAILQSFETPLSAGIQFERRAFTMTFASEDQKEGMRAFMAKRKPEFKGK